MMKKILFFLALPFIFSCDKEDENVPEIPSVVLKVKKVDNEFISTYFYNEYGYVDSIAMITDYGGISQNYYKKFTYNQNKEITKIKTYQQDLYDYENQIPINEITLTITEFEYINNLIVKSINKNEKGEITEQANHNYDSSGNLVLNNSIYSDEKLIETYDDVNQVRIKYNYDNKFNPYYFIYPKAFLKLHNISKNNITKITYVLNNGQIQEDIKTLKYNNEYFCTYRGISFDNQLDDYNKRTYFYY